MSAEPRRAGVGRKAGDLDRRDELDLVLERLEQRRGQHAVGHHVGERLARRDVAVES